MVALAVRGLLPRHLEIIYEINRRFLGRGASQILSGRRSCAPYVLIEETGEQYVRMSHLACVGTHASTGFRDLHTQLLKDVVMRDFNDLWPDKFLNITNGVTPRRCFSFRTPTSPGSSYHDRYAGTTDLYICARLEPFADNVVFPEHGAS